jgi:hexosaminidase
MAKHLAKKGRRIMGWDEILNGDVPKSAIGQSWRVAAKEGAGTAHVSGAQGAVKGHDMVMSPHNLTYYSYLQGLEDDPFLRAGPKLSLEKAYTFDPAAGVPESARSRILGGQCCMWGEYLWNRFDLGWRMWPRAFAMSEILWTAPAKRDFADFERRAAIERKRLISMGVNCAPLK